MEKEKKVQKVKAKEEKIQKYIVIIVAIAIVIAILVLICNSLNNNKSNTNNTINNATNNSVNSNTKIPTEEDMIRDYKMTKEDAKNVVKSIYNSDNYEFIVEITEDYFYKVIVNNTVSNSKQIYRVNPSSKTYTLER